MREILILMVLFSLISCEQKVIQLPVQYENDRQKFMEFSQDLNKEILREDNEMIEKYLEDTSKNFKKTSYNFWISNSAETTSSMAKTNDEVTYELEIKDLNGNLVYSKEELGIQKSILGRSGLSRGLHLTLQMIEEGDSATGVYPSFLVYGNYGDKKEILGSDPLEFGIKILDIKKNKK